MSNMLTTILGGGLAGMSASYHLGHENCEVYEKNDHLGGHISTDFIDGFTWDEGPHVSFTKNEYVRKLLSESVENNFLEYPVATANYYHGTWIPHPAQTNLYAIPQPIRDKCLYDFLNSREDKNNQDSIPKNYGEWLKLAFGETFYSEFPRRYTKKYWTLEPEMLTVDWVGERVFYPDVEEVKAGYEGSLEKQTHYITKVRYPKIGGFFSYASLFTKGINKHLKKSFSNISFSDKYIVFDDGSKVNYKNLVSTIPLPELIENSDAPAEIKKEAEKLSCSSVLLINVIANHTTVFDYNWMYVYDEDKYSTRINCTEKLSPANGQNGQTGVQVEVYFSKYSPLQEPFDLIAQKVCKELVEMGIIRNESDIIGYHTKWVQWANVIFDHARKTALDNILDWLSRFGLQRNEQDLNPMTDWESYKNSANGTITLAGRFAEWKYYWTDDCILRGAALANKKVNL